MLFLFCYLGLFSYELLEIMISVFHLRFSHVATGFSLKSCLSWSLCYLGEAHVPSLWAHSPICLWSLHWEAAWSCLVPLLLTTHTVLLCVLGGVSLHPYSSHVHTCFHSSSFTCWRVWPLWDHTPPLANPWSQEQTLVVRAERLREPYTGRGAAFKQGCVRTACKHRDASRVPQET